MGLATSWQRPRCPLTRTRAVIWQSVYSGRHILESRCAERCANDAFSTSFRATLKDFIDQKRDEKMYKKSDPIFRCTPPSTGKILGEVVVGTLYRRVHKGGSPLPMNPRKFQVSFQNQRHARSLRASTFSRSITAVFHRMRMRRSFNFQSMIDAEIRTRKTV